jgi:hypothetical protein
MRVALRRSLRLPAPRKEERALQLLGCSSLLFLALFGGQQLIAEEGVGGGRGWGLGRVRGAVAGAMDLRLHEFVHVQHSAAVRIKPDRVSRDIKPPPRSLAADLFMMASSCFPLKLKPAWWKASRTSALYDNPKD